jgi:RimJ/RimL family protein N-acetyltransferase
MAATIAARPWSRAWQFRVDGLKFHPVSPQKSGEADRPHQKIPNSFSVFCPSALSRTRGKGDNIMMDHTQTKTPAILLDLKLPITTPRLVIRPVMTGDGAEIFAAKTESWDMVRQWMPWAHDIGTVDEDEAEARRAHARYILREDFRMIACERDTMRPVVFTGLHRFDWDIRRVEIGYWCRRDALGQGYVTESTNALIRYAFGALNARTVAICHADGNDNSRRVIERLGLTYEGRSIGADITPDGVVHDRLWYSTTDTTRLPELDVRWGTQ